MMILGCRSEDCALVASVNYAAEIAGKIADVDLTCRHGQISYSRILFHDAFVSTAKDIVNSMCVAAEPAQHHIAFSQE